VATREEIDAGQAVYSPFVLHVYDWFVLGVSNSLFWRCPTRELRALYDRNVRARHLDVGVGTGFYLDHAKWPAAAPQITLVDLNANSLAAAQWRIRRYAPQAVKADALAPLPALGTFESAGLCYLLHCLPGSIAEKSVVFDHLHPLLAPRARIFGATIVQGPLPGGARRSRTAQALMGLYNRKGIFSNSRDTFTGLEAELKRRFAEVEIRVIGTVATFEATAA